MPRSMAVAVLLMLSPVNAAHAQDKGGQPQLPKRKVLMTNDLGSVPGHEGIVSEVKMASGVKEAKHTHPGELLGYVVEGAVSINVEGKPTTMVKSGEAFFVPADTVHWGECAGPTACRVISTFVVPKGKPLTTAVK
jgi:quercetin dioxygenase-like cupin family protein